jgi:hypothetical protein
MGRNVWVGGNIFEKGQAGLFLIPVISSCGKSSSVRTHLPVVLARLTAPRSVDPATGSALFFRSAFFAHGFIDEQTD